jgi:hypothetical protein
MLLIVSYVAVTILVMWTIWPTMRAHNKAEHREAIVKAFFLWLISSLPVVFAFLLARPSHAGDSGSLSQISGDPFAPSEQFVYACSFIAPVLYVFVDTLRTFMRDRDQDRMRRFRSTLKHYDRVLLPSLIVLLFSIVLFVGLKIDDSSFRRTSFYRFAADKAVVVYFVSIMYWYCVILIESPPDQDFVTRATEETDSFVDAAARRIREGKK